MCCWYVPVLDPKTLVLRYTIAESTSMGLEADAPENRHEQLGLSSSEDQAALWSVST